ncbi:MAG: hypothetical protein U0795_25030 [Pirellulales bacterium]
MSDFEDRLKGAVDRGFQRAAARADAAHRAALTEEELRQLHTQHRLHLSDSIEQRMKRLPDFFPGFRLQSLYGDEGWGVSCSRDDFAPIVGGSRKNLFSRIQLTIRPYSHLQVLEMHGKATIRNREIFNRNHFEKIVDVSPERFEQLMDAWILEFAELYAAG